MSGWSRPSSSVPTSIRSMYAPAWYPTLAAYLNDRTRFWVVRPRLSGGQISGLGTLVGGTYIGVDLGRDGVPTRVFKGLETPPIITASEPGRSFTLKADSLGSLSIGSPVQYRGIEVGRVTGYTLREPSGVDIQVFVHAPHDQKVTPASRFWNISGVQLALDSSGVRIETDSLAAMLLGGVAFGGASGAPSQGQAEAGSEFVLFANRRAAFEPRSTGRQQWQLEFAGSVRGLLPGAPVEFRGIRVGEVVDLQLEIGEADGETRIPVVIAIEPDRLGIAGGKHADASHRAFWDRLVGGGLRAQLKTGNLLTGALFVDLDFYPDDPPQLISWEGERPALPTVLAPLDELRGLLSRLARLPLDEMGRDLSASLASLSKTMTATNALLKRLDRETASELTKTLQQTRKTLASADKVLAPNSPLQSEAYRALRELAAAARSFRIMADYLERHPEALIRGKGPDSP